MKATLFTDGGARGNPGPAASGAVLLSPEGAVMAEVGRYLGTTTNNVAEWNALCIGLEAALQQGVRDLSIRMDSELVVKQVLGEYRVKHAALRPFHRRVIALLDQLDRFDIKHVPRAQNKLADKLVNRVLDEQ